ncbi:hypothetical protein ABPG72_019917 [Tetrahymena utriculariae]
MDNLKNFSGLSQENTAELKCGECIFNESCLKDYISISNIRFSSEDHVFTNWPPVDNPNLLKDLKGILKINSQIIEKIESQFDKIAQQITSYLAEQKKNFILQAESLNEQIEQILESYQSISDISKLKQLINLNQEKFENQINELKPFVSEFQKNKETNTAILQEQITKLKEKLILKYDFFQLQENVKKYFPSLNNQFRDLSLFGMNFNYCQKLLGTFAYYNETYQDIVKIQEDLQLKKISISKMIPNGQDQVYFKYNLTNKKKKIIRFKFNDEAGYGIYIGLVGQFNINTKISYTHLAKTFGNSNQNYGSKVVQGSQFFQIIKDQIIEMRVDIKQEKLQFSDYPSYTNINELSDQFKLDKNGVYHLAIQFLSNSNYQTCLDLIYFEQIEN